MRFIFSSLEYPYSRLPIGYRLKSAFIKGAGHLSSNFRWKETSPTNLCKYRKTRMIILSCGIKISAVCSFVSSQSICVTDGWTDRQNYDPQDRVSITASRGKNERQCVNGTRAGLLGFIFKNVKLHVVSLQLLSHLFYIM